MAAMGAIDIIQLTIGIISGYFSIVGASACNYTISMIICGLCVMGFWSLYCGVCIYLGINRCGDLYGGRFMVPGQFQNMSPAARNVSVSTLRRTIRIVHTSETSLICNYLHLLESIESCLTTVHQNSTNVLETYWSERSYAMQ
uniref:AA_permease domain-containing protein n=1 Tax=Ascaris lumbricoides TaxID=6252 RepID=A0A0M3IEX2_ASCLU